MQTFQKESEHLDNLLPNRDKINAGAIHTGNAYVDDCLGGVRPYDLVLIGAGTGVGKCLGPNVGVLRWDGSTILAKDVRPGDLLMGPDNRPRRVLSTTKGRAPMRRIVPTKGEPWECNDVHVMTLVHTTTGRVIDVDLNVFESWSTKERGLWKLFTPDRALDFTGEGQPKTKLSPYFVGVWLGDGSKDMKGVRVSKPDPEIRAACAREAELWGAKLSTYAYPGKCPSYAITTATGQPNPVLDAIRQLGVNVPHYSRVADRLELLAGIIDTDGYLTNNTFEVVQKSKHLFNQIVFLARSLGFRVTTREKLVNGDTYHRMFISGHVDRIPTRLERKRAQPRRQRKNANRHGFLVEHLPESDYCGWTLDGDGRFLLADFTVTHNTQSAVDYCVAGSRAGKKVYGFFLEAEEAEFSARRYFQKLGALAKNPRLDFASWWRGEHTALDDRYKEQIISELKEELGLINTFYKKKGDFTNRNLAQQLEIIREEADLIVLDHIHVVDSSEESENTTQGRTIRILRDTALDMGIPVVVCSHIRKKQHGNLGQVLPTRDELHGSSSIAKVATQIIMLARDWDAPVDERHLSATLVKIEKDRRGRENPYVARQYYDMSRGTYEPAYSLGRMSYENRRQVWEEIADREVPQWAKHEARVLTDRGFFL